MSTGLPELARRRIAAGLSQGDLGKKLKSSEGEDAPVTGKTIYNWETGRRRPNTDDLRSLAAALSCRPEDLLTEPTETEPTETELPLAAGGEA